MNLQGTADRRRSFINTINEKVDSGEHGKIHYAKCSEFQMTGYRR